MNEADRHPVMLRHVDRALWAQFRGAVEVRRVRTWQAVEEAIRLWLERDYAGKGDAEDG